MDAGTEKRDWVVRMDEQKIHSCLEETNLELRLGLPGQGLSNREESTERIEGDESLLSLGYVCLSSLLTAQNPFSWNSPFHHFPSATHSLPVVSKEIDFLNAEKQAFLLPFSGSASPINPQKRSAPAPVVGWPPVRSFRKNLTSTTSITKSFSGLNDGLPIKVVSCEKLTKTCNKGQFVKINMEGVPIGRKVDLSVNDSYEKLSSAVIELFRSLHTGERDGDDGVSADLERNWGLMDRSGEYSLVYENNEGDQFLAVDVPWNMFVSTVKRLRVLKSSELSGLTREFSH